MPTLVNTIFIILALICLISTIAGIVYTYKAIKEFLRIPGSRRRHNEDLYKDDFYN